MTKNRKVLHIGLIVILAGVSGITLNAKTTKYNEEIANIKQENFKMHIKYLSEVQNKKALIDNVNKLQNENRLLEEQNKSLSQEYENLKHKKEEIEKNISSRGTSQSILNVKGKLQNLGNFQATAYDAGYESTGKSPSHKDYGITASGSRVRSGVVAVDPRVIPLGTKLHIEFQEPYKHLTGQYVAEDTGGAIKGNIIDVYMESGLKQFGRRNVQVSIIK